MRKELPVKTKSPKRMWIALARIGGLGLLLALFSLVMIGASRSAKERQCSGVEVTISERNDVFFIEPEMLVDELARLNTDTFRGVPLSNIDLSAVESALASLPHVARAEAWIGPSQRLCVLVEQRRPLLRVMHNEGVSYYLDIHGEKMPSTRTFTARVPVLTGLDEADGESLGEAYGLAKLIHDDPFLAALVEQIHRTDDGEYVLVPKVGDHLIRFGGVEDGPEKFRKLRALYSEGLYHTGWDVYSTLDLRYRDLVYGTRRHYAEP
jgi:cell division protein FtsQ